MRLRWRTSTRLFVSNQISMFYNRGRTRAAKGDLDAAIADYSEAIRINPDFGDAFCNRGMARQAKDDIDGALADYDQAIRLQPADPINFNNRGVAREAKGDLEGALADYHEAILLKRDFNLAVKNREDVLNALAEQTKT